MATPALLTGTSSEFLGRRALPRIVRERPVVMVLGPPGSGKTSVANRLCEAPVLRLSTCELNQAHLARVKENRWSGLLLDAPALVLDGPVWLRNRPAAVQHLKELLRARSQAGRRTMVVENEPDGSVQELARSMPPGSVAVLGLRFPKGSQGRMRFARRICDELGLPRSEARGTATIEPWGYAEVVACLEARLQELRAPAVAQSGRS